MRLAFAVIFAAATLSSSNRAFAGKPARTPTAEVPVSPRAPADQGPFELRNTTPLVLGLEFVGFGSLFLLSTLTTEPAFRCGWCETNAFDRSVRRALVMDHSRAAATASHVLSVGVAPAIAIAGSIVPAFSHGNMAFVAEDATLYVNAGMLSFAVTDVAKKAADRRRPGFTYGREKEIEYRDSPNQEFVSFYSSDTALAFTFASSGTTIAYLRGYSTAPYVAVAGGVAALGTGILRISADMHWATDVITGAVVGTGFGFGLPYLFHGRDETAPRIAVAPSFTSDHKMLVASGEF